MDRKKFLLGLTAVGLAGLGVTSPTGYDRQETGRRSATGLARELHDGIEQSLRMVEMAIDALRRRAEANLPIGEELARIQSALREELRELREGRVALYFHAVAGRP